MKRPKPELPATMHHTALTQILGFDEKVFLELQRMQNPLTKKMFIPPTHNGMRKVQPTIKGVIAWLQHRATNAEALPVYGSMEITASQTGIPVEAMKWLIKKGADFKEGSRIRLETMLKALGAKLIIPLFAGDGKALTALDAAAGKKINREYEEARKAQAEANMLERKDALENKTVHVREDCEEWLWTNLLSPLKSTLASGTKTITRAQKQILSDTTVPPDKITAVENVVSEYFAGIFKHLENNKRKEK